MVDHFLKKIVFSYPYIQSCTDFIGCFRCHSYSGIQVCCSCLLTFKWHTNACVPQLLFWYQRSKLIVLDMENIKLLWNKYYDLNSETYQLQIVERNTCLCNVEIRQYMEKVNTISFKRKWNLWPSKSWYTKSGIPKIFIVFSSRDGMINFLNCVCQLMFHPGFIFEDL